MASIEQELGKVQGEMKGIKDTLENHRTDIKGLYDQMDTNKTELLTAINNGGHHCIQEEKLLRLEEDVDNVNISAHGSAQAVMEIKEDVQPLLDVYEEGQEKGEENRKELKRFLVDIGVLIAIAIIGFLAKVVMDLF